MSRFKSITSALLTTAICFSAVADQEVPISTESSINAQIQLSRAQADKSIRDMQKTGTSAELDADDYLEWINQKNKALENALTNFDQYLRLDLLPKMKPWMARYNAVVNSTSHSPDQKQILLTNLQIKVAEYVKTDIMNAYHFELSKIFATFLPFYLDIDKRDKYSGNRHLFMVHELASTGWTKSKAFAYQYNYSLDDEAAFRLMDERLDDRIQKRLREAMTANCKSEICYGLIASAIRSFDQVFSNTLNRSINLKLADGYFFTIPNLPLNTSLTIKYLVRNSSRPEPGLPYEYKKH